MDSVSLPVLINVVTLIPFLVSAVLLVRAVKNWATITLMVGASCMNLAPLLFVITYLIPSSPRYEGMYYAFAGAGLAGGGMLCCLVGVVGVGIKYAATVRRAKELEVLLQQVQERIDSGERI